MIRIAPLLTAAALSLTACAQTYVPAPPVGGTLQQQTAVFSVAPPNAPSGPVVDTFARNFLDSIQASSIADRAEYCGYFFVDAAGLLQATPARRGTFAACEMPAPQVGQGIIASYHTHGAYGRGYDNEVPSAIDLISDFDYGIDGYVSTPGGRVWLVDFQTRSTRQVCGLRCVTSDPNFVPSQSNPIQPAYSLADIQRRNSLF